MTQVKEIQSILNTNRMVKVLLPACEVGGLYCAQIVKKKLIWYVQRLKRAVTPRHAGLDEHKLMTRAQALKLYENRETKV